MPTLSPTLAPTLSPTLEPTLDDIEGPIETTGLKVTLGGIRSIESNSKWERATADYFAEIYNDSSNISGAKVTLVITDIVPGTTTSRRGLNSIMRSLQSDSSVEVTYNQIMSYRSSDSNNLTNDEIVQYPLSTKRFRDGYVGKLKLLNGYKDLTDVSPISSPTSNGSKAGKGSKTKSGKGTKTKSGKGTKTGTGTKSAKNGRTGSTNSKFESGSKTMPMPVASSAIDSTTTDRKRTRKHAHQDFELVD